MFKTLIQADELLSLINQTNCLVFDCRFDLSDPEKGSRLYDESHIPGAQYAHLDVNLSSTISSNSGRHPMPDNNEFINWLSSCGFNGSQQIVVYDDSFGAMASRLWWLLKGFGHEAVALLDGGWQNWLECGYEVSHKKPGITAKNYTADFDQNYIVTTEDVVNNFEYPKFGLIDVRAAERFNGVVEPIDSIAGHIPGAINIPLTENLDSAGRYKSSDALRELYKNLQKQWPSNQQVFMCGSGVTACHSLLALSVAGFDLPKVYAGSWSEWIRDLSRPMVKQSL